MLWTLLGSNLFQYVNLFFFHYSIYIMFKHWKTSIVGVLLAGLQALDLSLKSGDTAAGPIIVAVATAILGLIAKDK